MDKLKKNKQQRAESNKNLDKTSNIKKKENLKINFESLQNDLKKVKEDNLRYLAEIDNLRKRFDKEREDTFKYAVTEFANEIILVVDNFVRVMESISSINKDVDDIIARNTFVETTRLTAQIIVHEKQISALWQYVNKLRDMFTNGGSK